MEGELFFEDISNNMEDLPIACGNTEDSPIVFNDTDDVPMSKNKFKKLKREQQYEARRESRKIKRKEKLHERRRRKRADRDMPTTTDLENSATANGDVIGNGGPETKISRLRQSVQLPVTIIIDCDFDDLMLDKERTSLAAQLTRCYSDNNKAPFKTHLAISSFGGHLKDRFDNVLAGNHLNWKDVRILVEDFVEVASQSQEWMKGEKGGRLVGVLAPKVGTDQAPSTDKSRLGEVVYLTGDSPDNLTDLKPYSTYIIGGLVDRNRHKGICYKRAMDRGMKTAKLPIGEYMQMDSRFVLTTNHVLEIMLRWLELGNWGEAFERVIPKRKGGVLKSKLEDIPGTEVRATASDDSHDDVQEEEEEEHGEGSGEGEEDGGREREESSYEGGDYEGGAEGLPGKSKQAILIQ